MIILIPLFLGEFVEFVHELLFIQTLQFGRLFFVVKANENVSNDLLHVRIPTSYPLEQKPHIRNKVSAGHRQLWQELSCRVLQIQRQRLSSSCYYPQKTHHHGHPALGTLGQHIYELIPWTLNANKIRRPFV